MANKVALALKAKWPGKKSSPYTDAWAAFQGWARQERDHPLERSPQFRAPPSANGVAPKLLTLAEFAAQHQAEGWDELFMGHQYDRYRQAARAGG